MDRAMTTRLRRIGWMLGIALALGASLSACGEAGDPNASQFRGEVVAQKVAVATDAGGSDRWDRDTYEATAGDVTFVVHNASSRPHQFAIRGNGVSYRSDVLMP